MKGFKYDNRWNLERKYKFITYKEPTSVSCISSVFANDPCFEYTYFIKLMDKLKETQEGNIGFWGNRNLIIRQMQNLTIVADQTTKEIVAFYVIRRRKKDDKDVIDFMEVFTPGKGIGKEIIQWECYRNLCVEESLQSSVGFWKKMGIPCEKVLDH